MWRGRAVRSLLVEAVAGLRPPEAPPGEASAGEASAGESPGAGEAARLREALSAAVRRAALMVGVSWAALVALLASRTSGGPFLRFAGEETVFSLGVLAVAVYSGFRLGQWEKYRAVERACREIEEREGPGA